MDQTPNLRLPYIAAAQAQKHVTHNEAIRALDAVVQLSVLDRDLATPPASPADGDRYIVAAAATGAWTGHDLQVAAFQDGAWAFHAPRPGWLAWVVDDGAVFAWSGTQWVPLGAAGVNPAPLVGVNATADAANRLTVASPASLFNHAGGGHRLKVNKAAAGETASLLLQTAFSGRAEVGLTGDDDLRVKVSADGSVWRDAITVDRVTGAVSLPSTQPAQRNAGFLVNGDFQINQRNFAGGALAAGSYGFDRWKAAAGGASLALSGFALTLTSGGIEQPIEPALWGLASLASTQVAISFEVMAGSSGSVTVALGSASATVATAAAGRSSIVLATGPGDTGNIALRLSVASGTPRLGRVKAEAGTVATPWLARSANEERALCWRYFWAGLASQFVEANSAVVGGYYYVPMRLPVRMRVTPTSSFTLSIPSNVITAETGAFPDGPEIVQWFLRSITTGRMYVSIDNLTLTAEL